jgi:hypothetical protein
VTRPSADDRVRARRHALAGYSTGIPTLQPSTVFGTPHDKLPDNALQALREWHAKEDAWL